MYNPLPYLPERFLKVINWLKNNKTPNKVALIIIGLLSTIWFLIRVVPKPSRATYPCMQATAPFMSGFVVYLLGIGGGTFALHSFTKAFLSSKYALSIIFLMTAFALYFFSATVNNKQSLAKSASNFKGDFPPNQPIGEAVGIFPGRVVWMYNEDATNENCSNTSNNDGVLNENDDAWFLSHNNDYQTINDMLRHSLMYLTESNTVAGAWNAIFEFYNQKASKGKKTFTKDEKLLIKINATTAYGGLAGGRYNENLFRTDNLNLNPFSAETNPWLVLALLNSLVNDAGIPQEMIYVGDPARNIYQDFYLIWHESFPNVNYLGNNILHPELDILSLGRIPVAVSETDLVFYADDGTIMPDALSDKLYSIFEEVDYLINLPTLKAHATGGITLAAKNHFGSFTRNWAMHLHPGLMGGIDDPSRLGYGLYRVQTDIMMHNLLGGKNLLMLVDGLYPGEDALGVPEKWQMSPFSNDWCSSIFLSLDPVAIESVCHDFLRTEYNGPTIAESRPNWDGVDDYLHQAADQALWPDGIIYDPDNDGNLISSLGVHEHWNNENEMAYTRNLETGNGIELIKAHESTIGLSAFNFEQVSVYPNPVIDQLIINNQEFMMINFRIFDNSGKIVLKGSVNEKSIQNINVSNLNSGNYTISISSNKTQKNIVFIKL